MIRKITKLMIICIFITIVTGCSRENIEVSDRLPDTDGIFIKILSEKQLGDIRVYAVALENQTGHMIVQNDIYLSYRMIDGNQARQNELVVRGKNNKLNIKHGEKVILNFLVPKKIIKTNLVETENPYIEVIGYFDKVSDETHFQMMEPLGH